MIYGIPMDRSRANTKIVYKGYEISIAMDNSCGVFDLLKRTDIRVYDGQSQNDVTHLFCDNDHIMSTAEELHEIFNKIDKL